MRAERRDALGRVLAAGVGRVVAAPWLVLVAALALTGAAVVATARGLGVHTDTAEMFARDVPFWRDHDELKRAFPQFVDLLVVVVDGDDAVAAFEAAERLRAALAREPQLFRSVYLPGQEDYFRREGLLFLSVDELEALARELRRSAPLLAALGREPSLTRLSGALAPALALFGGSLPPEAGDLLASLGDAAAARAAGASEPVSWRAALAGSLGPLADPRQVLLVQPQLDYERLLPAEAALTRLREIVAELDLEGRGARVRLTGEVYLSHEELLDARRGVVVSLGLSIGLVGLFLWLGLRSVGLVVASLVTLVVGLAWTAGSAALLVGHLNLISVAFAVLYVSLGVASSLHFALRYREVLAAGDLSRRPDADERRRALHETARSTGTALTLAAATTAIGFLAFVPTDFRGVAELGVIAGAGMVLNLLANLTVLPALLATGLFGPTRLGERDLPGAGGRLASLPIRHARVVRAAALALAVASLPLVLRARFDPDPLHLRDPASESVETYHDLLGDERTTPGRLVVLVEDERRASLRAELEALPQVSYVLSLADLVPTEQERKLEVLAGLGSVLGPEAAAGDGSNGEGAGDAPTGPEEQLAALERLADAAGGVDEGSLVEGARRLGEGLAAFVEAARAAGDGRRRGLLAGLREDWLGGLDAQLGDLRTALGAVAVGAEDLPPEVTRRWIAPDGRWRLEIVPVGDLGDIETLQSFVAAVRPIAPQATGGPAVIMGAGVTAVGAFQRAFAIALVAVTAVLLLLLRSVRDVLLVLSPLVLAGLLTVAATVVIGLPFNFANVIALPLFLGIGVDNGIHVVHRERSDPGAHGVLATSTARAVLFSNLTTLGGFGSLAVSPHLGTASLGQLLALGIGLTLVTTLWVLPALLVPRRP